MVLDKQPLKRTRNLEETRTFYVKGMEQSNYKQI